MNLKTIQREAARRGLSVKEEIFDGEKTYAIYRDGKFIGESNNKDLLYLGLISGFHDPQKF